MPLKIIFVIALLVAALFFAQARADSVNGQVGLTKGTCVLDGGAPSKCSPVTVPTGAICNANEVATLAAAIGGIGVSITGTTMTLTSALVADSGTVAWTCQ